VGSTSAKSSSEGVASACAFFGGVALIVGFFSFVDFVSSDSSRISAAFIWTLVVSGFALSLIGLVLWCRHANKGQRRRLSGTLLGIGVVTFFVALLGHVLLTLVAIAIPVLLLGMAVWLAPAAKTGA